VIVPPSVVKGVRRDWLTAPAGLGLGHTEVDFAPISLLATRHAARDRLLPPSRRHVKKLSPPLFSRLHLLLLAEADMLLPDVDFSPLPADASQSWLAW
jgi:hypothetical protein